MHDRHRRVMSTVDGENCLSVSRGKKRGQRQRERLTETQEQASREQKQIEVEVKVERDLPNVDRSCVLCCRQRWSQGSRDRKWNESLFTCNHLAYLP